MWYHEVMIRSKQQTSKVVLQRLQILTLVTKYKLYMINEIKEELENIRKE